VRRSPLLGEHTDEILRKVLGYSAKEIAEIKDVGRDQRAGEKRRKRVMPFSVRDRRGRR
jgi:hypothetical protein